MATRRASATGIPSHVQEANRLAWEAQIHGSGVVSAATAQVHAILAVAEAINELTRTIGATSVASSDAPIAEPL
ncbi:MAG: hypothetical protein ACRDSP_13965 [Pseudonocardiaceae bacterium]